MSRRDVLILFAAVACISVYFLCHPSAEELVAQGLRQCEAGDLSASAESYSRAIDTNRNLPQAWHGRGVVCLSQEDWDGAARDFGKAVELGHYPELAIALTCRGRAREHLGDVDGALADHNRALKIDPKCIPAYINRGFFWDDAGKWHGAVEDFTRVIELRPERHDGWLYRGVVRLSHGEAAGAAADLEKAIQIKPAVKELLREKYNWPPVMPAL
jgi:tetratricopeptide (TPR) repeat protein